MGNGSIITSPAVGLRGLAYQQQSPSFGSGHGRRVSGVWQLTLGRWRLVLAADSAYLLLAAGQVLPLLMWPRRTSNALGRRLSHRP